MKTFVVLTVFTLVAAVAYAEHINALGVPPQDNHNPEETASRVYQPPLTHDPRVRRDLMDLIRIKRLVLLNADDDKEGIKNAGG